MPERSYSSVAIIGEISGRVSLLVLLGGHAIGVAHSENLERPSGWELAARRLKGSEPDNQRYRGMNIERMRRS